MTRIIKPVWDRSKPLSKTRAKELERIVKAEARRLHDMSIARHGESYVSWCPLWRDCESKRRVRLGKMYYALRYGHYVGGTRNGDQKTQRLRKL